MANIKPGESRAILMTLEEQAGLPTGLLQSVVEHKTGWREQPVLPKHRQAEVTDDRVQEFKLAASRLSEKLQEFDGITPLAIDAYLRGDKATRRSLTDGFDQPATDDVHGVLARWPKYGGEEMDDETNDLVTQTIGTPKRDLSGVRQAPPPQPRRPAQLQQNQDGRYFTGDPFLDAVMRIESKGDTNAVSPTGATGLFQFTRGTGRDYGLITEDGRDLRKDPTANFEAMKRLTADNRQYLIDHGIEPTPGALYMAHQQGAGGAVAILRAARNGTEVPPDIRKNMNLNNGAGKTPAQFYEMFASKVNRYMGEQTDQQGSPVFGNTGTIVDRIPTEITAQMAEDHAAHQSGAPPTLADAKLANDATLNKLLPTRADRIDWKAEVLRVFGGESRESTAPTNVQNALKGILKSV